MAELCSKREKCLTQLSPASIIGELEGIKFRFQNAVSTEFDSEAMMMKELFGGNQAPVQFGMGDGGFDAEGPAGFSTMNMGSSDETEGRGRFGMMGMKSDGQGWPTGHASAMGMGGFEVQGSGRFGSTSKGFSLGKGSLESGRGDDSFDIKSFPGSDRW